MNKQNQSEPSIQTVGRNIRRWREHYEMKCEDLASKIGICKASLSKIENGQTNITVNRITQIATALELTSQLLLTSDPQSIVKQFVNQQTNI